MRRVWLGIALVSLMLASAISLLGGYWFSRGGRVMSVASGSMVPTLHIGDAVLVQKSSTPTLRTGDIISYHSAKNPNVIITHRIIRQRGSQVITKGDALSSADPTVASSQIIGKAWAVAPKLGTLLVWLRKPVVLAAGIFIPAAGIASIELGRLQQQWRPTVYRYRRS